MISITISVFLVRLFEQLLITGSWAGYYKFKLLLSPQFGNNCLLDNDKYHFLISCHTVTCLFYDIPSINIRATVSLKSSLLPSVHFCPKASALEGVLEKD